MIEMNKLLLARIFLGLALSSLVIIVGTIVIYWPTGPVVTLNPGDVHDVSNGKFGMLALAGMGFLMMGRRVSK